MRIKNTALAVSGAVVLAVAGCNGMMPTSGRHNLPTSASSSRPPTAPVTSSQTPAPKPPTTTPAVVAPTTSTTPSNPNVQQLFNLINQSRAQQGLPPLKYSTALEQCGQRHVEATYAAANGVYQAFTNAAHISWRQGDTCQSEGGALAENQSVGIGSNVQSSIISIHQGMMSEGPPPAGCQNHYSAIMNPDFTEVGIGMKIGDDGAVWVSEEFR